jgi:hypothetical protein
VPPSLAAACCISIFSSAVSPAAGRVSQNLLDIAYNKKAAEKDIERKIMNYLETAQLITAGLD